MLGVRFAGAFAGAGCAGLSSGKERSRLRPEASRFSAGAEWRRRRGRRILLRPCLNAQSQEQTQMQIGPTWHALILPLSLDSLEVIRSSRTATFEYLDLRQEVPDETNSAEVIERDFPPKRPRLLSAVDPAIETDPHLAHTCPNRSRRDQDDPDYQKKIWRFWKYPCHAVPLDFKL